MIGTTNVIVKMLPNYSKAITVTETTRNVSASSPFTYTCPSDGWIFITLGKTSSSGDGYIDINGVRVAMTVHYSAYFAPFTALCSKGDQIKVYGESGYTFGLRYFKFIPII
jgi:hypothetical protein